jgi:hypothetical protein
MTTSDLRTPLRARAAGYCPLRSRRRELLNQLF